MKDGRVAMKSTNEFLEEDETRKMVQGYRVDNLKFITELETLIKATFGYVNGENHSKTCDFFKNPDTYSFYLEN